ncbi:MAG TPA: hypothetical protein O0X66_01910 [Methanocorpusculum sp.]|nr:hypothetical protein [Methanocorpusculum sp.]
MDIAGEVLGELPIMPIIIVPGGGIFADFIREENLDDDTSHWRAIDAMDKYGRYLSTFGYPVTTELVIPEGPTILLPKRLMQKADPLPHSWDITSDSIAAWIAGELSSHLLVIKSTDSGSDLVDPSFWSILERNNLSADIINGRVRGTVRKYFQATRL